MGLDLTIAFEEYPSLIGRSPTLAFSRMRFHSMNYGLGGEIAKRSHPYPHAVNDYQDEGLKEITTDRYGEPLTYIFADDLVDVLEQHLDPRSTWDWAIVAFLRRMPVDQRRVILIWC